VTKPKLALGSSLRAARIALWAAVAAGLAAGQAWSGAVPAAAPRRFPHVLLITVDTLRTDHISGYGYARRTSPHLDALLARGGRFTSARTVEPLTGPALASVLTSLPPHEHGATRNGLPVRAGLPSLSKILARRGYRTAAFVGNWTLRGQLSGLQEHFSTYEVLTSRKRWYGMIKNEATADDLNAAAVAWLDRHLQSEPARPVFLWVHYVEPHAPYRYWPQFAERLGLRDREDPAKRDRYDTEVAFVDQAIGDLLGAVESRLPAADTLTLFTADHGESLGEHEYWGHGRHLFDDGLRIPMAIAWPGKIAPRTVAVQATNLDLAPTVLSLVSLPPAPGFRGFDWSGALTNGERPAERGSCFQAHKGAVQSVQDAGRARRGGLLEVGYIGAGRKEIVRVPGGMRWVYDLERDPGELASAVPLRSPVSPELRACLAEVERGLTAADALPPAPVDQESIETLRALGYID
jgi:arylsulfatase A-like enzyme